MMKMHDGKESQPVKHIVTPREKRYLLVEGERLKSTIESLFRTESENNDLADESDEKKKYRFAVLASVVALVLLLAAIPIGIALNNSFGSERIAAGQTQGDPSPKPSNDSNNHTDPTDSATNDPDTTDNNASGDPNSPNPPTTETPGNSNPGNTNDPDPSDQTTGFTLTYNFSQNGGTSATKASDTLKGGTAVALTATAAKTGWQFVGWNTNKDATTGLSSYTMPASNTTLFAIFRKTLTATFRDHNGTTPTTRTSTVTIYNNANGGYINLPALNTYTGWISGGWTTDTSPYSNYENPGTARAILADTTFYGRYWKQIIITYNANGGHCTISQTTLAVSVNSYSISNIGSFSIALPTATKPNSTFFAWQDSITGQLYVSGYPVQPIESKTYTAVWH
jgi:hypothetical protein